jgi:hypothetical protein
MRGVRAWVVAMGLIGVTTSPALAGMAAIETTAPLTDESEASVKAAVSQAVEQAMQGAKAMGLPKIELRGARVLPGAVTVLIIAKDVDVDPLEDMLGTQYDAEGGDGPTEAPATSERSTL